MPGVLPTYHNRIRSLDVLRGAAVLGILLANIVAFCEPLMSSQPFAGGISQAEMWVDGLRAAFVSGKFRGMLAILFGVGLALQFTKRSGAGNWPGGYAKRTAFLLIIGLIHLVLIWHGDILVLYSLTAFIAMWVIRLETKPLIWLIVVFVAMSILLHLGMAAAAGLGGNDDITNMLVNTEVAAFTTGSYLDQVIFRLLWLALIPCVFAIFLCEVLALYMIGIVLHRTGMLAAPSQHPKVRNLCLLIGFGIGLPLNLLGGWPLFGGADHWALAIDGGPSILLAIGYVTLGAMVVEWGRTRWLTYPLEQVGRIALTAYLLQSLLASAVFYPWGGRLYGDLNHVQQLWVVLAVWIAVIAFAMLWRRRYALGPVEWAWRSATEGRRVPLIAPPKPPPPTAVGLNLMPPQARDQTSDVSEGG